MLYRKSRITGFVKFYKWHRKSNNIQQCNICIEIYLGLLMRYKSKAFREHKANHRTLQNSFSCRHESRAGSPFSRQYCQPPWNPLWKLVSRGYWPQKFGTSSKNTSLEEQSNKFSVKDLVHHHKCYYLGSKISSIGESKLASTDRKVKQSPVFKPDWWRGCRGNGILGIKPLNCYILFVRFLNLLTVTVILFLQWNTVIRTKTVSTVVHKP